MNVIYVVNFQRKLAQHSILNPPRYPANNNRWRSYWRWVATSYETAMNKMTELETQYRRLNLALHEAKQMVDLAVLREHDIIGLTTTGAAKIHASLCALSAPIGKFYSHFQLFHLLRFWN